MSDSINSIISYLINENINIFSDYTCKQCFCKNTQTKAHFFKGPKKSH